MEGNICDLCTGCGACAYKCPQGAIYFSLNERKEYVAKIDKSKCIECCLCKKICPQNNEISCTKPNETYAAWTNNDNDYLTTSSGGLGTLFAKEIIRQCGAVYGASFIGRGLVKHIRIDSLNQVDCLKGSKYIQSDFRDVFTAIEADIKRGKSILVVGVPCQIAALRSVFTEKQLTNVLLVDLVCHGTPPEEYFVEYLQSICSSVDGDIDISFRRKAYKLKVSENGRLLYHKKYEIDPYYRSFMYNLIFRENCYSCKYSKASRIGDLTISDFWGIDRTKSELELPEFVSCLLINTSKGKNFFERIKKDCTYERRDLEEAVKVNANLQKPSMAHPDRSVFLESIKRGYSFNDAVKRTDIHKKIIRCMIMDVLKAPYRRIKYGRWGVKEQIN